MLTTMRMDFANFYIQQFRPHIQLSSVEYEREKFKTLLETSQSMYLLTALFYLSNFLIPFILQNTKSMFSSTPASG